MRQLLPKGAPGLLGRPVPGPLHLGSKDLHGRHALTNLATIERNSLLHLVCSARARNGADDAADTVDKQHLPASPNKKKK